MLPSPSLEPPLLSASWSPPLLCGMPLVEPLEDDPLDSEDDPPDSELDPLDSDAGAFALAPFPFEPFEPQPTATTVRVSAAVTTNRANTRGLRMRWLDRMTFLS